MSNDMYKLISTMNGLMPEYYINNFGDILYGLKNKNELFFNQKMIYKGKIDSFRLFNKSIFISKSDEKIFINENIKRKINIDFGFFIVDDFSVLFNLYSNDYSKQYYKYYNFKEDKEYWTIEKYFGNFIHQDNYLFTTCYDKNYSNKKICKISLTNPQTPLWQFDLSPFGTSRYGGDDIPYNVIHFLGVWQGKLLAQLTHNRLIALDIHTGELLNDTNSMQFTAFPTNSYMKMHLLGDTVHWLYMYGYAQIDLHTFKVELKRDFTEIPEEQRLYISHSTLFQNKLYFVTSPFDCFSSDTIGVFDIAKNDIIWHKNLLGILEKGDTLRNEAPKVTADKLYIPTSKAKLFIFEKTSNENV